jgi:two-component system LytT family response regulator
MIRYVIIEDEMPAKDRLERMVKAIDGSFELIAHHVSVSSAVKWFRENPAPDVIFMDIQLSDGDSFEIFHHVQIGCPVVFITAYDQYAIRAFKVNSIDYLLKPVKKDELAAAITKFKDGARNEGKENLATLLASINAEQKRYRSRLLVRFGDTLKTIETGEVAYFFTRNRTNQLCLTDGTEYPIDQNLEVLEKELDPTVFYRVNRQFIVNIKAISKMVSYSKSRVKLELKPEPEEEVIVSTDRSPDFKKWLSGEL